jgi:hypothetical protein
MTWELTIEYVRGSYRWIVYRDDGHVKVMAEQGRCLNVWEAIDRAAYVMIIWPQHLN